MITFYYSFKAHTISTHLQQNCEFVSWACRYHRSEPTIFHRPVQPQQWRHISFSRTSEVAHLQILSVHHYMINNIRNRIFLFKFSYTTISSLKRLPVDRLTLSPRSVRRNFLSPTEKAPNTKPILKRKKIQVFVISLIFTHFLDFGHIELLPHCRQKKHTIWPICCKPRLPKERNVQSVNTPVC